MISDKTGVGIKFPFVLTNGAADLVSGHDLIEQSMTDILSSESSRFFLGEYKNKLKELKFQPNDIILLPLLSVYMNKALKQWEKRAKVSNITFNIKGSDYIECTITYKIIGESTEDSFVYPFYKKIIF